MISKFTATLSSAGSRNLCSVAHSEKVSMVGLQQMTNGKYHMLPSGELLIRRVDESDKYRSYQCRAVNRLTGASLLSVGTARFSVTDSRVVSTPRPIDKQVSIHARKDQTVVLPCFAEGNPPPTYNYISVANKLYLSERQMLGQGYFSEPWPCNLDASCRDLLGCWCHARTTYARWFRQDRHQLRVITEADDRMFVVGECLAILHVDEGDAGRWVCVANNTAGVERIDLTLQVTSAISIMIQPSGQLTVDVGGRAEMQCIVTGSLVHTSSPTWLKDGHVIGPVGTSLEKLILENVQRDDAGMYQCIVRGEDDSAQSSVQLQLGDEQDLFPLIAELTLTILRFSGASRSLLKGECAHEWLKGRANRAAARGASLRGCQTDLT
uniref:Ig-like domain-containing protein n=1 Tax=Timema douglasi TaxID=61478 RepID=A0A7R8VAE4_TIMDO|nr:unnamed protein product [Timema douglasi]